MKMLSDPQIVKDVHLYVSKEKAGDDVAPPSKQFDISLSNHPNESVLLREGGVYGEGEGTGQLTMKRPQRPLRRSKRLNVIQVTDQCDDDDGGCNNGEQFAPGHESEALDNEQGQDYNQVDKEVRKRKRTSLRIVWNMPKGQRIVVKCNANSQPIGDEGAILGKFLGTIARNGGFCPLNINDSRGVKKNSGEETILQCVQALAEKNIISRSLVKNSHNAGTKSFACWTEDMVYLATHKKKDDANAENIDRNERLAGDHDVNQLQIQENSSSPQDLVIDSVPEVREMRDPTGESFSRQNQQGTRTVHPHLARSRKRHTSTIKAGFKVVLKTSSYPNKRNVAYGTIRSTDSRTKACGIELGAEFALVCIDQPLLDNEQFVREVFDCKINGEAFSSGYLIAWPSPFIREKDN
ncbi:hypothetical protein D1007_38210 [Hordeum vulgare]|nr:hypothetical protein D1007_38210 [Hordeum vulgare]